MIFIIFGAPGSGKGTQADLLSEKYEIEHISTGDILRQAVKENTDVGKKVKAVLDAGELVGDDLMVQLVKEKLTNMGKKGFILDGFPRTVPQAKALDKMLIKRAGKIPYKVIYLNVDEEDIVKRISLRRVCQSCGRNYNELCSPPKSGNICDQCGCVLHRRSDDKESTVRSRFKTYMHQTYPVIDYYKKRNSVLDIMADKDIENVFRDVLKGIERDTGDNN